MITNLQHALRFVCSGADNPAVTSESGQAHSRTRQAVFAGLLVLLVGAGGVTARAAYGARGAGGDAARPVATPAPTASSSPSMAPLVTARPVAAAVVRPPVTPPRFTSTLSVGAKGAIVGAVQQRLIWTGLSLARTSVFDAATVRAVRTFQVKQSLKVSGRVDLRTYKRLVSVTPRGAGLDPRCATTGKVLCIDKSQEVLRYLVDGRLVLTIDARFGSADLPTREGVFHVYIKSRYQVSTIYHTPMPFAMFFSGGAASF